MMEEVGFCTGVRRERGWKRTNGCASGVHAIAQPAGFHEVLDGGDFIGNGGCGGSDLSPGRLARLLEMSKTG
jgi:hypothetical protein